MRHPVAKSGRPIRLQDICALLEPQSELPDHRTHGIALGRLMRGQPLLVRRPPGTESTVADRTDAAWTPRHCPQHEGEHHAPVHSDASERILSTDWREPLVNSVEAARSAQFRSASGPRTTERRSVGNSANRTSPHCIRGPSSGGLTGDRTDNPTYRQWVLACRARAPL
jgi:hypothetical protein